MEEKETQMSVDIAQIMKEIKKEFNNGVKESGYLYETLEILRDEFYEEKAGSLYGTLCTQAKSAHSKLSATFDKAENLFEIISCEKHYPKKELYKELDGLHTKIVSLADSIDTTETVSLGTKEVWAKYASDIHDELEVIMIKRF